MPCKLCLRRQTFGIERNAVQLNLTMRIPDWTPALKPQPLDLVDAILKRLCGTPINLDKVLFYS